MSHFSFDSRHRGVGWPDGGVLRLDLAKDQVAVPCAALVKMRQSLRV
jgi:hypothetical protein